MPLFTELQKSFEARKIDIRSNAIGTNPEDVLVIETIGDIENFANAVKRINGLEWMGEFESTDITPDDDFYDEENKQKELVGHLYLVMTNQQALQEMLSLWKRYQANPSMKFARGLTKFRTVFQNLRNIRRWNVQDRLIESGAISAWENDLKHCGNRCIRFETELWFRGSKELRNISGQRVTALVQQAGGNILGQTVIEEIAYHGLLAELPAKAIQTIVTDQATELVKCEDIMFFRPVGQMVTEYRPTKENKEVALIEDSLLPSGDPVVALLDGVPLSNHCLLSGRLMFDDPDNWEAAYTAIDRVHGTAMASLIVHGDLNQQQPPLSRPVYVRPIMKPIQSSRTPRPESVPEDCLLVDLIHRSVRRLFDGDQDIEPVAPKIKVINLSIGDPSRQFTQSMSPLARLIDWLSAKYNVLFVISSGNHPEAISLDVPVREFNSLSRSKLEQITINSLYKDIRNRKLLSPAESINGLTVGSVHHDNATIIYQGDHRIDPFIHALPSPISAFGSGYRRSIKPDIIFYGGRQLYQRSFKSADVTEIVPAFYHHAPGNKTASPSTSDGDLKAVSYSCGTSNATALISRFAGICYDSLQQNATKESIYIPSKCEAPLLKAFLVHGCSWGDLDSQITKAINAPLSNHRRRELISKWIGYGIPNVNRVLACTEQRATVFGFGVLSDGRAHVYRLPLPPSLSACPLKRRLTVTLAWLSPVLATAQKYRVASLWFDISDCGLVPTRTDADRNAVKRGTVQHEIFEGTRAEPFNESDAIEIKVNCREDVGKIQQPIAYGLVVSLEVAEGVNIDIYNEIRTRIKPKIQIQQTTHP